MNSQPSFNRNQSQQSLISSPQEINNLVINSNALRQQQQLQMNSNTPSKHQPLRNNSTVHQLSPQVSYPIQLSPVAEATQSQTNPNITKIISASTGAYSNSHNVEYVYNVNGAAAKSTPTNNSILRIPQLSQTPLSTSSVSSSTSSSTTSSSIAQHILPPPPPPPGHTTLPMNEKLVTRLPPPTPLQLNKQPSQFSSPYRQNQQSFQQKSKSVEPFDSCQRYSNNSGMSNDSNKIEPNDTSPMKQSNSPKHSKIIKSII